MGMPEAEPLYHVEKADLDRVDDMFNMVERNIRDQRATDPIEGAFLEAAYPEFFDGGKLRPHLEEAMAFRRTRGSFFPTGYALRTLEFSVDKQARLFIPGYPNDGFDQSSTWKKHDIFGILDYYELVWDMQINLQSNMADAYGIYHLLTQVFKDRWGQKPTVLDTGSSMALGLKKWLLPGEGFNPIKVVQAPDRRQPIVPGEMPVDEEVQSITDHLMGQSPIVGKAVGYDAIPINPEDKDAFNRVFSHTFPMSESLRRPDEVAEFRRLMLTQSKDIVLPWRNIHAEYKDTLEQLNEFLPGGKADIAIFSAMLFEQESEKIKTIFDNVAEYCNEGALFFITDFIKADKTNPQGFSFIRGDWWHRPGSFATFVMDPFRPDEPAVEIARFTSRRGTEMWLSPKGRELFTS